MLTLFFFDTVAKGMSANMLKVSSKRRRTQAEIKADKEAKLKKEHDEAQKDLQMQVMQEQIRQLQENMKTGALATDMMQQFVSAGLVEHKDEDQFIVHGSHGDREFKASKQKWWRCRQ